jgi:hypothetical protein
MAVFEFSTQAACWQHPHRHRHRHRPREENYRFIVFTDLCDEAAAADVAVVVVPESHFVSRSPFTIPFVVVVPPSEKRALL